MTDPREVMRKALGIRSSRQAPENPPATWGDGTGVLQHYHPRPCRCRRCPDCGGTLPWWERYRWPGPYTQPAYI